MHALTPTRLAPLVSLVLLASSLFAQGGAVSTADRARRHDDPNWRMIQGHLPDPATASAAALEQQADLLRVRRFPEDALDYYTYALKRGGSSAMLLDKIGLVQLELRNIVLAQAYFRRATKADRRSPQGWNNLAATEYLERQYSASVSDYKKAVKLDGENAVFHANLSTAYFESKNYKGARREAEQALRLDPLVFQHTGGTGVAAHILSVEDRARFAFEMARLYAQHGEEAEMLHSLAVACENGFEILPAMAKDPALAKYRTDPRIDLLVTTAHSLRPSTTTLAVNAPAPPANSLMK